MESPPSFRGPVNLGNPCETTVVDVANLIRDLTGTSAPLVRLALPSDDPRRRCPDIRFAQRHLNWQPAVSLRDGLAKTIAEMATRLGITGAMCASGERH
jgi:UDP-glucuronate decarboxylase